MKAHLLVFEDLIRQMKTAGVEEADLVISLFQTLPDTYDPLVTALENIPEEQLSLEVVKQRLIAEELKRSERHEDSGEAKAAAFSGEKKRKSKKFQGKCHNCGKRGHFKKDCRVKGGEANSAEQRSAVSFVASRSIEKAPIGKVVFKLDSGSSDHLVNDLAVFSEVRKMKQPVVIQVAKDGETLVSKTTGTITGRSNKNTPLNMKDVLYVPELRDNLMSVKKLVKAGVVVTFCGSSAILKKNDEVIATAKLRGNLYEIEVDIPTSSANMCQTEATNLWHRRLGHLGQQGMKAIVSNNLGEGADFKADKLEFCEACVKGKQSREPFNGTRPRATRPLERIHSDVCGPIEPAGWDGSKYFVSFIDDHTHFAMLFMMKRKSEVFDRFREYEAMVTAQFNMKISKLTIDQGREYLSNEQKRFYSQKGIQVETTVAYTPQQNGVAERFNRTIVEKVRTMLIDSCVPKTLWPEAVLTAVYLVNRSPTAAIPKSMTPAECWFGQKPSLEKLRIFGCKAFAWIPNQQRKKLDAKSHEAIMVGYAPNGYRLWDKKSRRIVIARDVKFNETRFPYEANPDKHGDDVPLIVVPYEQEGEAVNDETPMLPAADAAEGGPDPVDDDGGVEPEAADPEAFLITDDEDDAEETADTGALPSQLEQLESQGQATLRRSERERRLPGKFFNFFTGYSANSAGPSSTDAPLCYGDIASRPDRIKWLEAVDNELQSMKANGVWKLTSCPSGVRPLKSKWVFRVKEDEDGQAVRYKARLVAKGYLQRYGVDFEDTYAPVAKLSTIRIVLAVGVHHQFHFHQMDVKTAFLHGDLKEDIYMEIPEGVKAPSNMTCKLLKSLYGLKQSPRCWNEKFNHELIKMGFKRSRHDYCLYTRCKEGDELYVALYVDDLLIAGRKLESIIRLKKKLSTVFCMTDCGEAHHFLGMKILYDREAGTLQLSQEAHVAKVVERFGLTECNAAKTPMEKGLQLQREGTPTREPYREMLGSLMYVMLCVRPDICFPVGYLGRYQQKPTDAHWQCLKRIVRYLKGSAKTVLQFQRNDDRPLVGFADADWAADNEDRKSVSGYVFKVFGSTVSWCSKKQTTVAISSSESEYVALSAATAEALWIAGILEDMNAKDPEAPVTIFEDNRGCIGMANNLETKRSKHIDVKHHFIRDHIAEGRIQVDAVGTRDQLADIFTKPLDSGRFQELRMHLGLHD